MLINVDWCLDEERFMQIVICTIVVLELTLKIFVQFQAGPDGETSTTVSSRSHIVENVVTESIAPSLLDAGYMNALLTTAHHSDPVKNVVTGSTIIFFDEEDQIDPTSSTGFQEATSSVEIQNNESISASFVSTESSPAANEPAEQINQVINRWIICDEYLKYEFSKLKQFFKFYIIFKLLNLLCYQRYLLIYL